MASSATSIQKFTDISPVGANHFRTNVSKMNNYLRSSSSILQAKKVCLALNKRCFIMLEITM